MSEITNLPYAGAIPFSTATPFTYREGTTNLEMIHALKMWAQNVIPELNTALESFWEKYLDDHQAILNDLIETKDQWQALFDQFMDDVVAQLEGLNDQAMANLIGRLSSETRKSLALNYSYGSRVDDHSSLQNAVSKAYADKTSVYLDGSEAVTGNIPNFWEVEFTGGGSLTREGVTFTPNPKSTTGITVNHIYVHAQTGNDGNDGLTPLLPIKSLSKLQNILRGLTSQQAAGARWEVQVSGVFPNGQRMYNLPDFPLTLIIQGDAQVGGVPVTRIENTTGSSPIGLWFEKCPSTVIVNDIWFDGFNAATGYGILGKGSGDLRANNCKFTNCFIGYSAIKNMDYSFKGMHTDSTVQIGSNAAYNASGTWDNCTFDGTPYAINVTRGTVCHVDYCHIYGATRGVLTEMHSRSNIMLSHFKRNGVAVQTMGGGEWVDTNNRFYAGTVDANGIDSENNGVGRESRLYSQTGKNEFKVGDAWRANPDYLNPKVVSGLGNQLVYAGTALGDVPANWFKDIGKKLRVVVRGKTTGTTVYSANVALHAINRDGTANTQLAVGTIRGGSNGSFKVEFEVWAVSVNEQRTLVTGMSSALEPSVFEGSKAVNFLDDKIFRLYCEPLGLNDTFNFTGMETYLMG